MTPESRETRLKRMKMRAWHRGTREMDLILGRFADARLERLAPDELELFDALMAQEDHDLYRWIAGGHTAPARLSALIDEIARHTRQGAAQARASE